MHGATLSVPPSLSTAAVRDNPEWNILCGAVGGLCSLAVGHPFDTVKVRMQRARGRAPPAWGCAKDIVAQEGARGLYSGMGGMVCLALPR